MDVITKGNYVYILVPMYDWFPFDWHPGSPLCPNCLVSVLLIVPYNWIVLISYTLNLWLMLTSFFNQQNISKLVCICVSIKTLKKAVKLEIIAIFTVLKNVFHCYICLAFRQHFDSVRLHLRHGASLGFWRHSGVAQSSIPRTFLWVVRTLSGWSGAAQSWNLRAPWLCLGEW